jgi:hypothetical protein
VPDVAAVLAANQLLEARQREVRESDEEALRKSEIEAQTSWSNARAYPKPLCISRPGCVCSLARNILRATPR